MKPLSLVASVLSVAVAGAFACSSSPSRPPVETTGTDQPSGGGGSSPAQGGSGDGGTTATSGDGGVTGLEAGTACLTGGCGGCCTATNVCETGQTNAQCGGNGGPCVACTGTQTCTGMTGCM